MSFADKKLEIAIAGFAIVMLGGMGYLLKSPVQSAMKEMEIVYEMPRPKSILAALFDLGDREISRDYKNPFTKKKVDEKKSEAKAVAQKPAVKPVAKKPQEAKKTVAAEKKPSVMVNVVGADEGPAAFDESFDFNGSGGAGAVKPQTAANSKSAVVEVQAGLSGDQWRALIQAQPTKENVAKLVVAYGNQEVDEQTFFVIVTDLLRNNKSETQALGLMALKGSYSARSFALAAQYFDQLTPEVQQQATAYMMTYAASGRLGMLATALKSENSDVVAAATQVVLNGYQAAKTGQAAAVDPRASRGDVVVNSVANYSQFIPVFQQLAQSQDGDIVSIASAALSQIQTSVAAL